MLIPPFCFVSLFWRICNPPVLIIRICNPINCSLFIDSETFRFERIANPYSIFRRITNHAETQRPPKQRNSLNTETTETEFCSGGFAIRQFLL